MNDFVRDGAATAAVFAFFTSSWFGWAQEAPPSRWVRWLVAGSVLSVVTLVVAGPVIGRHRSDGTIFDETTGPRFGIILGVEFGAAALGSVLLQAGGVTAVALAAAPLSRRWGTLSSAPLARAAA